MNSKIMRQNLIFNILANKENMWLWSYLFNPQLQWEPKHHNTGHNKCAQENLYNKPATIQSTT
jgi:hypothetical protein